MQFIDLAAQQKRIRPMLDRAIGKVLDHGRYIMGPEVKELEDVLSAYCGVKHAISCSSGTDALMMPLMAKGVGPGDAIITTPFTFIATAEVISILGAVPVFVDIDPSTFNLDPVKVEEAILSLARSSSGSPRPKGIITVDLFGLPADYDRINAIARRHGLFVIEDAAQSFGAEYHGKKAGALAELAATSFFPAKPLGGYGDGGMCFTDDDGLAEIMRSIRIHGKGAHQYDNVRIGINGRLDTLQAAILLAKLTLFPEEFELRQEVADRYNRLLYGISGISIPVQPAGFRSAWAQYTLLARDAEHRSLLQSRLNENGIPTAVYYPRPLHLQPAFADLGYPVGTFPVSEDFANRVFSLPMHPYLEEETQERIAHVLADAK